MVYVALPGVTCAAAASQPTDDAEGWFVWTLGAVVERTSPGPARIAEKITHTSSGHRSFMVSSLRGCSAREFVADCTSGFCFSSMKLDEWSGALHE
jgi:hypothetical protein